MDKIGNNATIGAAMDKIGARPLARRPTARIPITTEGTQCNGKSHDDGSPLRACLDPVSHAAIVSHSQRTRFAQRDRSRRFIDNPYLRATAVGGPTMHMKEEPATMVAGSSFKTLSAARKRFYFTAPAQS
jgi:hypothetical protein